MEDQIPYAGQMLGVTLFVVGLIVSWVVGRRRGAAHGIRGVAWSLLFLAAGLTGLIDALWGFTAQLLGSILSPVLWAGLVAGGLAVVLYVVSGVMKARGVATTGRSGDRAGEADKGGAGEVSGGDSSGGARRQVGGGASTTPAGGGDDDLGDIEELLRRRGI